MKKILFIWILIGSFAIYVVIQNGWFPKWFPNIFWHEFPKYQTKQPLIVADKNFSNTEMNVSFNYPGDFRLTQIDSKTIAIDVNNNNDVQKALLIYSTTISSNDQNPTVPFDVKGIVTSSEQIPIKTFDARQVTYSDGKNKTTIVTFKKNQHLIVMRIPQDSTSVANAITDIVNSIKLIKE